MIDLLKRLIRGQRPAQKPRRPRIKPTPLENHGSQYGGWNIPKGILTHSSVCYLAGAGEDISFDVELVEKFKCEVHIVDPTPRARIHFDKLIETSRAGIKFPVNNSTTEFYTLSSENVDLLHFHDLGLWDEATTLKFYTPKNLDHVSHSALNLQKTKEYFEAKVTNLKQLMIDLNHTHIDLLKIDIEGSEYKVIDSIIRDNIDIKVLCIEFDEVHQPKDSKYAKRIEDKVTKLISYGMNPVFIDENFNCTFVKKNLIGN